MADPNQSSDQDSTDLADTRTDWAEDRTILANERTFAGWMRTGMASVAVALGLKAVFKDTEHLIFAKAVAEIFIFAAVVIFWTSALRCRHTLNRMTDHDIQAQSRWQMTFLAAVLACGAVATGFILWLL